MLNAPADSLGPRGARVLHILKMTNSFSREKMKSPQTKKTCCSWNHAVALTDAQRVYRKKRNILYHSSLCPEQHESAALFSMHSSLRALKSAT